MKTTIPEPEIPQPENEASGADAGAPGGRRGQRRRLHATASAPKKPRFMSFQLNRVVRDRSYDTVRMSTQSCALNIAFLEPVQGSLDEIAGVLASRGYVCHRVPTCSAFEYLLEDVPIRLAILDWEAPDIGRYELLASSRRRYPTLPFVLGATQEAREEDLVSGLEAGADAYVDRQLGSVELLARIDALMRRVYPHLFVSDEILAFGAYRFNPRTLSVEFRTRHAMLTRKEFDVALLLFRNMCRPVTRREIAAAMWGQFSKERSRSIDTHVSSIRKKLMLNARNGYRLTSIHRFGYQLDNMRSHEPVSVG
ncbi:response regulator transcription factor [Burkholderia pyrrocinia]|uniref:response regulator transcription factor n=1 Tax=Burkholderia pyrrocinia TaxID=60550 RepID=UPI0015756008|nr:response regulator transcription factor [Burkholderia pyrrocinia]NTX26669.1 response regulator transcription factor [Burkholderia pyrrocinia]